MAKFLAKVSQDPWFPEGIPTPTEAVLAFEARQAWEILCAGRLPAGIDPLTLAYILQVGTGLDGMYEAPMLDSYDDEIEAVRTVLAEQPESVRGLGVRIAAAVQRVWSDDRAARTWGHLATGAALLWMGYYFMSPGKAKKARKVR